MNVREFVAETLTQVVDGVTDAQKQAAAKKAYIVPGGTLPQMTKEISFDIAVSVTEGTEKDAKGGLTVWGIGAGASAKSESSTSTVSRVKFSVPVQLPTPD